ncbi:hypothetical protein R5R35_004608 [Gryllus longicercus]|uniref:Uncharacterized protein n=1 Tax=Gryllus longicercus TaxID=2509291 RepID=A0AAN9W4E0_9ORTH
MDEAQVGEVVVEEEDEDEGAADTSSGVVLRYLAGGDEVECVDGALAGVELHQVDLSSGLEGIQGISVTGIDDEREIISLAENVLISTTIGEGDFAVLNWEGEEIIEMSTSETFEELEQQIQQTVSSADGSEEGGIPVDTASLARHILLASRADSTTASAEANNNIIVVREDEVSTTEEEGCPASSSSIPSTSTCTVAASQASSSTSTATVVSSNVNNTASAGSSRISSALVAGAAASVRSPLASPPGPFSPQNSGISSSGSAGEPRPGSSRSDTQVRLHLQWLCDI